MIMYTEKKRKNMTGDLFEQIKRCCKTKQIKEIIEFTGLARSIIEDINEAYNKCYPKSCRKLKDKMTFRGELINEFRNGNSLTIRGVKGNLILNYLWHKLANK